MMPRESAQRASHKVSQNDYAHARSDLSDPLLLPHSGEVFARIDVGVLLRAILLLIELSVAAVEREQLAVRSPLDDLTLLENENLIGALDGREAMGDDERRTAPPKR